MKIKIYLKKIKFLNFQININNVILLVSSIIKLDRLIYTTRAKIAN